MSSNLLSEASSELSSLGRVFHRLAMTESGEPLQKVLSLLLPRLLSRMGMNHKRTMELSSTTSMMNENDVSTLKASYDAIQSKLVEMISHIMKRVKADDKCQLPCVAILELLYNFTEKRPRPSHEITPFTLNLSLTFLTVGLPRCSKEEVEILLPGFLAMLGVYASPSSQSNNTQTALLLTPSQKSHSCQFAHLTLRAIETLVTTTTTANSIKKVRYDPSGPSAPSNSTSNDIHTDNSNDHMDIIRNICSDETSHVGSILYDLLLDILLFQPLIGGSESTLPPPGLSSDGNQRLLNGSSIKAQNWLAEFAPPSRLKDLKLSILDFISPSRVWDVFDHHGSRQRKGGNTNNNNKSQTVSDDGMKMDLDGDTDGDSTGGLYHHLGTARIVALLVVATGDLHLDVSDRAATYLKSHMDSMRNAPRSNNNNDPSTNFSISLIGSPLSLACELLTLTLGGIISHDFIAKNISTISAELPFIPSLGYAVDSFVIPNDPALRTAVMSTKRRMCSEKTASTIMNFLSSRIFDDLPGIFSSASLMDSSVHNQANATLMIAGLAFLIAKNYISSGHSSSGSSYVSNHGNPKVSASQLLNSVSLRLSSFCDTLVNTEIDLKVKLQDLLGSYLTTAHSVISKASSAHGGDIDNSAGIEMRDSCYGVVANILRSSAVMAPGGYVFNGGDKVSDSSISTTTAVTLFGCVCYENEKLKPRSVAVLDSMLSAYVKFFDTVSFDNSPSVDIGQTADNPWNQSYTFDVPKNIGSNVDIENFSKSLVSILWNAGQDSKPKASRHASAQWADKLLKRFDHVNAVHLLCYLAGDSDTMTQSTATAGLGIGSQVGEDEITFTHEDQELDLPSFNLIVPKIFSRAGINNNSKSIRPTFHNFSSRGKAASLRFGLLCLLSDVYGGENSSLQMYMEVLLSIFADLIAISGNAIGRQSPDNTILLDEAAICIAGCTKSSHEARVKLINSALPLSHKELVNLSLSLPSSKARRHAASTCGHLYKDFKLWNCSDLKLDFDLWLEKTSLYPQVVQSCLTKLRSTVVGEIHGASFLGAECIRAARLWWDAKGLQESSLTITLAEHLCTILSFMGRGLLHNDEVIGNSCARSLSIAFSYDSRDAPILYSFFMSGIKDVLCHLCDALKKYGNGDHFDPYRLSYIVEATGIVLAASIPTDIKISNAALLMVGECRLKCVDALFSLLGSSSLRQDPELGLSVGEALGCYADAYSPEGATWKTSSREKPIEFLIEYAHELPPHKQVLYMTLVREIKSTNPHKRTACATVLFALVSRVVNVISKDVSSIYRAFSSEVLVNLSELQSAFIHLLADPKCNQLSRESCCLGLATCRALALKGLHCNIDLPSTDALNNDLLKAFGQTTNYGGSAMMESRSQNIERLQRENRNEEAASAASIMADFGMEASEVGGTSGMGEAALGAFREMASVAVSLGRPDLLYSLMILSVSSPTWSTSKYREKYHPSKLLPENECSGNMSNLREAFRPFLSKLIPRLLRACHDPNKETREQMSSLWAAYSGGGPEARSLIDLHFLSTVDTLMDDAVNKLWRARVGACRALSEIIVGRTWLELGGGGPCLDFDERTHITMTASIRLIRLFNLTVRSLDDVRLTVRESGEMLSRSVRSLSSRLCDPLFAESEISSSSASSTILSWLVKFGLNQPCAEATGFSISCLLSIVDVAKPISLEPVLPQLIFSLMMAMSNLEPAVLNYLQVRVAGRDANANGGGSYDQLERVRLQLAQSGPIAGALQKCLDMLKVVKLETVKAVIPQLDAALRCGAGFSTRAAAADAVSSLCTICPLAFRFPGTSTSNPTVRLLRALYFASERERGSAARDKMSHALGNLAALAPGSSVRGLAIRACNTYRVATGSNDDLAVRRTAASSLRAIAVRASNQFADGGSRDIWIRKVLPLAYLGQNDTEVGSYWKDIWDEGGQVANADFIQRDGSSSFEMLLQEKLLPQITTALVSALNDVSWSRRLMACQTLSGLADIDILAPNPPLSTGTKNIKIEQDWNLRLRRRCESSTEILTACVTLLINTRLWTGKAFLLKTISKIAAKWALHSKDSIVILQNSSSLDLFDGDKWFENEHDYETLLDENSIIDKSNVSREGDEITDNNSQNMQVDYETNISSDEDVEEDQQKEGNPALTPISYVGLCRLLLNQAIPAQGPIAESIFYDADALPYRVAALESLSELLCSVHIVIHSQTLSSDSSKAPDFKCIYKTLSPYLLSVIGGHDDVSNTVVEEQVRSKIPPILVAKSLDCLASSMYHGMGQDDVDALKNIKHLVKLLMMNTDLTQPAWTIRESSALAASSLSSNMDAKFLLNIEVVENLIKCTENCLQDKKFWKVRLAGLKLLLNLCGRAGVSQVSAHTDFSNSNNKSFDQQRQLVLESLLPHKEKIIQIARLCMSDKESKVMACASDLRLSVSWWP